jgi:hypothetical protein
MGIFLNLSSLALRGVVGGASESIGFKPGDEATGALGRFLIERFSDQSKKLTEALRQAGDRAWRALEIALAGESFWQRCKSAFSTRGDERAFAEQVRLFLDGAPLPELAGKAQFRQRCLQELQAARKADLLTGGKLDPQALAQQGGAFARFNDPQALLEAEGCLLRGLAEELNRAGHTSLGWLVEQRPQQGSPLLALAVRYFFRRAVETDSALFQGLAFVKLEALAETSGRHFDALAELLAQQGSKLETLLLDVHSVVVDTHDAVLDLRSQIQGQNEQLQQLGQAILQQLEQRHLDRREVRPADSLSIRNEGERQAVKALVARYRALPEGERQQVPALLNALGKLEVVVGDFDAAQRDFLQVAELVDDNSARAEAHHNAYQAALERRDWPLALTELIQAIKLDNKRFVPFPVGKYHPERILGAGGFGVAFLCRHRYLEGQVVVKTLRAEDLEGDAEKVFSEAQLLRQLDHPAIIRIADCGFVNAENRSRPFLVMDYFEGGTLEEHVEQRGPLPPRDWLGVARAVAEGLEAAHAKGILHRDVKPANILVRRAEAAWQTKLIDFGLALKQAVIAGSISTARQRTLTGSSIAGTLDFAAPEQLGKVRVSVGPYSDVYGFGKTSCFALFGTTVPLPKHFRGLPESLTTLLEDCLEERPDQRPGRFSDVLQRLQRVAADLGVETRKSDPAIGLGGPPAPPPPADWYYLSGGKQCGPVAQTELRRLAAAGQLLSTDLVWTQGMPAWVPARTVKGLVAEVPAPPPPPPAPPAPPAPPLEAVPVLEYAEPPADVQAAEPVWLVTIEEFAEATYRFWRSGKASGFAPNFQQVARDQARKDFLAEVVGVCRFLEQRGLPFFADEAWVGGGANQTMRLTTYRVILTTPQRAIVVIPLHEIEEYVFQGAAGTLRGFFAGSDVRITGRFGNIRWTGLQLENLHFPRTEFLRGVLDLAAWRSLPREALRALGKTRDEILGC